MNLKKTLSLLAFCVAVFSASLANAAPITWTLQNAVFGDGGSASGWFSVDSTSGNILNWDITTTAGSTLAGFQYDATSSALFGQNVWVANPNSFLLTRNTPFAQPYLNLSFVSALTTPGTVLIDASGLFAGSWECNNCSPIRSLISGSANSVPEPATIALMGLGLAGLGVMCRRKMA